MKLILGIFLSGFVAMAAALYSPSDDVAELTASNFQREVVQSDDLWLVEFYAPWCGHCKSLAPEWKKAASALKGIVKVGAVDMDVHQAVGGPYGIRGFPTIKIFGLSKSSPSDYQGQRTAQAIVDGAMTQLKQVVNARLSGGGRKSGGGGGGSRSGGGDQPGNEADVIQLTDGNFDEQVMKGNDLWLVEFFAPWCGHCKRLAPEWAKAATALKGKVKVAAVDSTVHTIISQRFGIQGYPTIKVFQGGEASEYEGGRTAADIISWASTKAAENLPPPEIIQATEQKVLTDACSEHQLCIVSILPHILDCQSECRNKYLQILKKLGDKYKKKMWGWVWAEGGAQPELEDSLGIGGFGYPAMAAVNSRKMKYAMLKGPFSDTGINEFLRELAVGRGSTAPVKNAKLPTITKSDPWDGKDGQLPVEDDIDLSDVDLDDMDSPKKTEL